MKLLRLRTQGNGPYQLRRKLFEQHTAAWNRQAALFLADMRGFAATQNLPKRPQCPQFRWLQTVYLRDVLQRLPEVKAALTSTFGSILKMDSTKKAIR